MDCHICLLFNEKYTLPHLITSQLTPTFINVFDFWTNLNPNLIISSIVAQVLIFQFEISLFLQVCSSFNFSWFLLFPKIILNRSHRLLKWILLRFLIHFNNIAPIVRSTTLAAEVVVSYVSQGLFLLILFFFSPKMDFQILRVHLVRDF